MFITKNSHKLLTKRRRKTGNVRKQAPRGNHPKWPDARRCSHAPMSKERRNRLQRQHLCTLDGHRYQRDEQYQVVADTHTGLGGSCRWKRE